MKKFVSRIWVPALLVMVAAAQSFGIDAGRAVGLRRLADSLVLTRVTPDTTTVSLDTTAADSVVIDSLPADTLTLDSLLTDSLQRSTSKVDTLILAARDLKIRIIASSVSVTNYNP